VNEPTTTTTTTTTTKRRRPPVSYLRSGLYKQPTLPGPDTEVGQLIAERRADLLADLGDEPSTAQRALVELALRTWVLLDSCDAFLLQLPSIVDKRHRRAWQIVLDRQRLAASLEATLCRLGLERRAREVRLDVVSALADAASRPTRGVPKSPAEDAAALAGRLPPISGSARSGAATSLEPILATQRVEG
jgi:hypothetical protein